MRSVDPADLAALHAAGLLTAADPSARTTRRWQAAMARAAARLHAAGAPFDLRFPIAAALVEIVDVDDETLVRYVEAMLAAESGALARPAAEGAGAGDG